MKIFARVFFKLIIIILLLGNCAKKDKKGPYIIGYSQYSSIEPLRRSINSSIFEEAKNYPDIKNIEFADAQNDPIKQRQDIESFLKMNVDLLFVATGEEGIITNVIKKVYDSRIPIIVLDKPFKSENYTCFIGTDNMKIGREAGEYAVNILNEEGNIIEIQGLPESHNAVERGKGFREIIERYPKINIIYSDFADWQTPLAITKMEIALRKYDDIDLVYAHNDHMAVGAYLASRSHKREEQIMFIGVGGTVDENMGLQAVVDGKINATFLYPTYGKEAIECAVKILKGKRVQKIIKLKAELVTSENIDKFLE